MGSSGREALTSLAVMKKFHGSSVPRPRMKKMSQTALYLWKGQSDLEQDSGQGRGQASLPTVPDPVARGTRRRREYEVYCPVPVPAPAPQPLLAWAARGDEALPRGGGRPSPGGYDGGGKAGCSSACGTQMHRGRCQSWEGAGLPRRVPAPGAVYSLFAVEKLTERASRGRDSSAPENMQERGSPRLWVPHPP